MIEKFSYRALYILTNQTVKWDYIVKKLYHTTIVAAGGNLGHNNENDTLKQRLDEKEKCKFSSVEVNNGSTMFRSKKKK